ncbi:glycosyltransferase [Duganella sp. BJB1802]|uniref:glycosyltransferase family 4 protein n=1 Tax=Duganella sp. BJB1802 TaxID=2744575 RepID=UPI001593993A|nr:glycosyltransferase [Duganella sp. BJB1802]
MDPASPGAGQRGAGAVGQLGTVRAGPGAGRRPERLLFSAAPRPPRASTSRWWRWRRWRRRALRLRLRWAATAISGAGLRAQRWAADRLELPGWLGREQVAAELAQAALFVLPSHQGGLADGAAEAMASGCAWCWLMPVGRHPQLVESGRNGVLVAPGDAAALAAALAALADDDALRARLGAAARGTIQGRLWQRP